MVHLNHSFFVGIINLVIKMSLTNKVPEKDVHDLFTRVAPHYDQMNNLISLGTQNGWRKKFFKELRVYEIIGCPLISRITFPGSLSDPILACTIHTIFI